MQFRIATRHAARLPHELRGIAAITPTSTFLKYTTCCVAELPNILKSLHLYAADERVKWDVEVHYHSANFTVPCQEVDQLLPAELACFASVREMFGRDVYLRAFDDRKLRWAKVVDCGSNRGLFSLFAAIKGSDVLAIDCEPRYRVVFELLFQRNGLYVPPLGYLEKEIDETALSTILNAGDRVSMMKMDIEGAEYSAFSKPDWLACVDNMTMEYHGRPEPLVDQLQANGFDVCVYESYLYASKTGALKPAWAPR